MCIMHYHMTIMFPYVIKYNLFINKMSNNYYVYELGVAVCLYKLNAKVIELTMDCVHVLNYTLSNTISIKICTYVILKTHEAVTPYFYLRTTFLHAVLAFFFSKITIFIVSIFLYTFFVSSDW